MASLWNRLLFFIWICLPFYAASNSKPNIIFMFADDIGFNELGYHGCTDTSTPFIDTLVSEESLILANNYVQKVCSPSRAAFLTGRYPSRIGLQNLVFNPQFPVSLTRQVSTLSNEFKHAGYSTHIIGKWHLGMQSWEYTPRYRGFDTFAGFYGGLQSYFTHRQSIMGPDGEDVEFYDLRENEDVCIDGIANNAYGVFWERDKTLELLASLKHHTKPFFLYLAWQASHNPDEAPQEYVNMYNKGQALHTEESKLSHIFTQAQTTTLDDSVKDVIDYLKDNAMWDNTLLVFSSDNGGDYLRGDNYPLRGFKNSSWEGGIRVPAFVSGGYLHEDRRGETLEDVLIHVTDWYPTLLSAAGIDAQHVKSRKLHGVTEEDMRFVENGVGDIHLDGKDLWNAIQFGEVSEDISTQSREILLDLNAQYCAFTSCGAIRIGKYKFLRGDNIGSNVYVRDGDQWGRAFATCSGEKPIDAVLGCTDRVDRSSAGCHLTGCLFNIEEDPCEYTNLVEMYPDVAQHMIHRLDFHQHKATEPLITMDNQLPFDQIDPRLACNSEFWCPFQEYHEAQFEEVLTNTFQTLYPSTEELMVVMDSQKDENDVSLPLFVWIGMIGLTLSGVIAVYYVNAGHAQNAEALRMRKETTPLVRTN
eukprot:5260_1